MKTRLLPFLAFVAMIILASCQAKTTSNSANGEVTTIHDEEKESKAEKVDQTTDSPTTQLVDLIRRLPGVNIRGSHPNVFVSVRGVTSTSGATGVLYVVGNMPMGKDYTRVVDAIDITRVKSVNVLKGGETGIYGKQGAGGVIVIKMKKNRED